MRIRESIVVVVEPWYGPAPGAKNVKAPIEPGTLFYANQLA